MTVLKTVEPQGSVGSNPTPSANNSKDEKMTQLFLDCDGVLADFDKRAREILGMCPREYEENKIGGSDNDFWSRIYAVDDFFYSLDPMPDAHELVEATCHLNPIILTGLPRGGWAREQKLRWRDVHFPDLEMICCRSVDKIKHAKPGDILVDDWHKYQQVWIDGGGRWVLHTSAQTSIAELQQMGVI
jgi:hypothetical protein